MVEAVLRAVGGTGRADDAVDEAFARAFAGWDRVQAMRSPAGWVYRVAVNEARRQLRRSTREDALLASEPPPRAEPPPGGETWLLVETLPVRQRAAVVLRHVAGLTEAQIGEALGVTRSTISSSLADAYRSLAAQLAPDPGDVHVTPDEAPVPLVLAIARSSRLDGCDVEPLGGGDAQRAAYSDAVRNRIKVRPGDLVALDASGPTVVWRWWSGRVEAVAEDGRSATVSRNIRQETPDDPRRGVMEVQIPDDLAGTIGPGEDVWFGTEDERKVVVAVAGPEAADRAAAKFPTIRQAIT